MIVKRHFVGSKAKERISKRVLQENKARQIFRKTNIFYPLIRSPVNTRFEIRSFALLTTTWIYKVRIKQALSCKWESFHQLSNQIFTFQLNIASPEFCLFRMATKIRCVSLSCKQQLLLVLVKNRYLNIVLFFWFAISDVHCWTLFERAIFLKVFFRFGEK